MERVQHEQEEDNSNELKNDDVVKNVVWVEKIKVLVDHVPDINSDLIIVLGTFSSLDKAIIRSMGRLLHTHCMKNKSIGEGYNSWS